MAKKVPPIVLGPERTLPSKANGFRRESLDFGTYDQPSAWALGSKRASKVWSPTRDLSARRLHIREV